jgi:hypothetical protein
MRWRYKTSIEYVISALNKDVMREICMADECIWRADCVAQPHSRFQRQIAQCAAAALCNAAALAAEVLSMGGVPPAARPRPRVRTYDAASIEEYLAQAQFLLAHYQKRLAMAERLGLLRLREVFRDIVKSKRAHVLHAALMAAAGTRPRQLS